MSALFVLIGISILVATGFLTAFLWSVNNGQFEDDYTPSIRMLFDEKLADGEEDKGQNVIINTKLAKGHTQSTVNKKP